MFDSKLGKKRVLINYCRENRKETELFTMWIQKWKNDENWTFFNLLKYLTVYRTSWNCWCESCEIKDFLFMINVIWLNGISMENTTCELLVTNPLSLHLCCSEASVSGPFGITLSSTVTFSFKINNTSKVALHYGNKFKSKVFRVEMKKLCSWRATAPTNLIHYKLQQMFWLFCVFHFVQFWKCQREGKLNI